MPPGRRHPPASLLPGLLLLLAWADAPRGSDVLPNDNHSAAGELRDGVLEVHLVAAAGTWRPEGREGAAREVHAFGERGGELRDPGPLLRVPAGTEIRATLRNDLDRPLVVHGLHDRPGPPDTLHLAPGESREVRFRAERPGTYFYWGTTRHAPTVRERFGEDTQLGGAIVVDPPGAPGGDHVFVISLLTDSAATVGPRKIRAAVVNGRSWPHDALRIARVGDTVRMRWINASDRVHPMHLHGFYFRVDARGHAAHDTLYAESERRLAVTELMGPGTTMALTWVPERPGQWLLHCHMLGHVSPRLRTTPHAAAGHPHNHTLDAMSGLVIGWRIVTPEGAPPGAAATGPFRRLRLVARTVPGLYGEDPGQGFVLQGDGVAGPDSVSIPGPPLVLEQGRPVRITVVNELAEPTSIHWHGIELESFFDGVSGWSGEPGRIAPHVAPGDSFEVRFAPPRAGTFIYHTHFEEDRQLASGMYGPLIVIEPGQVLDPAVDHVLLFSQQGPEEGIRVMLNGSAAPRIELEAGRRHRLRLINISPNLPLVVSLLSDSLPATWLPVAKDGADLPAHQRRPRPAVQVMGVGEAYDFELQLDRPAELALRVSDPAGVFRLAGTVRVEPAGGPR
ncbi:MAG TPA: multicopper oxidase domain-containing protein [Gemmatimonadota bacterium]|nr:multicopper oxidase domain-containing protein [Gemmatimonadota bacterium]